jgi:uncharacterized protein (DUF983 family)
MDEPASERSYNAALLDLIPKHALRVVEVECGNGALAQAYKKINPHCHYVGIEAEAKPAGEAARYCDSVLTGRIEDFDEATFNSLLPSSAWLFANGLERVYDPWALLTRIRRSLMPDASVIACIVNLQHWSIQASLNSGAFRHEDSGLREWTRIRWFTKKTIAELFASTGFEIVEGGGLMVDEVPQQARALAGVRALAEIAGIDPEEAVGNAIPIQWLLRAVPATDESQSAK